MKLCFELHKAISQKSLPLNDFLTPHKKVQGDSKVQKTPTCKDTSTRYLDNKNRVLISVRILKKASTWKKNYRPIKHTCCSFAVLKKQRKEILEHSINSNHLLCSSVFLGRLSTVSKHTS